MLKIFIDWNYEINPKPNHTWIAVKNKSSCDRIISVNKPGEDIVWLYEPEAILPIIYRNSHSYKQVLTHKESLNAKNKIVIPPCIPAWVNGDEQQLYKKSKLVNMVASTKNITKGHKFRLQVADMLSKKNIDVIGFDRKISFTAKVDALKDYMFSVAMENCISDTYYTEKLLDCFLTGTIPIYWGTKKVLNIFDPNGIIFLNEDGSLPVLTEDLYYSKQNAVKNNLELAKHLNYNTQDAIQFLVEKL